MMVNILQGIILALTYSIHLSNAVNPAKENCLTYESNYPKTRACECVVYQSYGNSRGKFTSPNFPETYPRNINCILYTFIGDLGEIIELSFLEFDLKMPGQDRCTDFLKFFLDLDRAEVNQYSSWNYEVCGNISTIQKKHYSSGRSLILEFHSDTGPGNYTGFRGIFQFLDKNSYLQRSSVSQTAGREIMVHEGKFVTNGVRDPGTPCTYSYISTNSTKTGGLFSPRYPQNYPPGASCQFIFEGLPGEKVKVEFENIQLHHVDKRYQIGTKCPIEVADGLSTDTRTNPSCDESYDAILVHDGIDKSANVIGIFCDVHNTQVVKSSGRYMYIDFYSDDKDERQGFAAKYTFFTEHQTTADSRTTPSTGMKNSNAESVIEKTKMRDVNAAATEILVPSMDPTNSNASTNCNRHISSADGKNGTITSPNYPNPYPGDITCRFTFEGSGPERVQLRFTHMDLYFPGGNAAKPHDCQAADSVTITIYINGEPTDLDTKCGRELPPMYMSNEHRMTVVFRSLTYSHTVTGFQADYAFVRNFGISTGEPDSRYLCGFNYKSILASSGFFTSPNYPGKYPRITECHYLFYGQKGEKVIIDFTKFEVDGVKPNCDEEHKSDYVSFSNFFTTQDRKMDRFCGLRTGKNNTVKSDGEFFKVTFKSNGIYDALGFMAKYRFVQTNNKQSPDVPKTSKAPRTYTIGGDSCSLYEHSQQWTSILCLLVFFLL
ncbi:bone morphogenetic protein 1 isoform X4 [Octopus sinensis]|uniref:Bone morphogenetic protein 1 isoform X4 n=1 Tax=Octopus sinensis TaxID=2607531 RepID=A0A6P7S932_9MOLL|nr:bone morphogenetic protein 1 isoform X4 [Octopus sinensis]